jgi:hypothetical protein
MQETVHSQTLADGTRIEQKGQRSQFYRDSQVRERQEIYLQMGSPGAQEIPTLPAGSQGNDRPIVVTHESWISQAPRISVLEKITHPRSGETIRRLTNIELTEPSADLFRVPADHRIRDEHE